MQLGAARIDPPPLHGSAVQLLDQGADVLDLPGRGARPELDGLGEAAGLHASPPSRAADGNGSYGSEYRLNADEAGCRKWVRIGNHHPQSMRDAIREREPILDSKASS